MLRGCFYCLHRPPFYWVARPDPPPEVMKKHLRVLFFMLASALMRAVITTRSLFTPLAKRGTKSTTKPTKPSGRAMDL